MQWANAGATATELRAKNAPRFLLDSGVRIDPVIRSHSGSRIRVVILEFASWLEVGPMFLLPESRRLLGGPFGRRWSTTRKSTSIVKEFCVGRGKCLHRQGALGFPDSGVA